MMIKSPCDSLNHRTVLGSRDAVFEVNFCRLAITLIWCFVQFITIKCIELINSYPKTGWEEFRTNNYALVILLYNYST